MALTLTYDENLGAPKGVWSPNKITLTSTVATDYIQVDISCNNLNNRLILNTDPINNEVSFDVNKILRYNFESDVLNCVSTGSIKDYYIYAKAYNTGGGTSIDTTDAYCWLINGTKEDYKNYLHNVDNLNYFTDNYNGEKPRVLNDQPVNTIYWNEELWADVSSNAVNELVLYRLNGSFRAGTSDPQGGTSYTHYSDIVVTTKDSSTTSSLASLTTDRMIKMDNIDPVSLNNNFDAGIDNDTLYYEIFTTQQEPIRVNIKEPNLLNDKYFRISWINKNGVKNWMNFDYNYSKNVNVDKEYFKYQDDDYNIVVKPFNTQSEEEYSISTGYITEEESKSLESLWDSPSVAATSHYLNKDAYYKDLADNKVLDNVYIYLNVKSMNIQRRRDGLINYTVSFKLSTEQINQKY